MLGDGNGSEYDITRLWRDARLDQALLEAERRIRPAVSGGSGCEGGAEASVSMDCPVVYPSDWDAEDYAKWSDEVNAEQEARMAWEREVDEIYAAEEVERMAREADERVNDH